MLCAFSVVLATLVIQGLTLRWLIVRTGVRDDGFVEREIGVARVETARAALRTLESDGSPAAASLRQKYARQLRAAEERSAQDTEVDELPAMAALKRRLNADQRQALLSLRAREVIGDAAFQAIEIEEELDRVELSAEVALR